MTHTRRSAHHPLTWQWYSMHRKIRTKAGGFSKMNHNYSSNVELKINEESSIYQTHKEWYLLLTKHDGRQLDCFEKEKGMFINLILNTINQKNCNFSTTGLQCRPAAHWNCKVYRNKGNQGTIDVTGLISH